MTSQPPTPIPSPTLQLHPHPTRENEKLAEHWQPLRTREHNALEEHMHASPMPTAPMDAVLVMSAMPLLKVEHVSTLPVRVCIVGSILSDPQEQEMGVPQGSILSPTLFNIKIDSILKSVCPGLEASLYVDDFAICIRGRSLPCLERRLQLCVNAVQKWVTENGFNFSPTKSVCIHFCKLTGMFPNPSITVKGTVLKVVQEVKFLGVIFDRKLSFLPHIKSLRLSCQKALDILRVVGHVSWGADRTVLLRLYRALIRSKLDYGSIIYGSARESYLKILDPIHHQGLRICLGAFRTTPVQSLYAEAGEPPLSLRRLKLMLSYACRLKSHPGNPAYRAVFRPQRAALYAIRTKEQKPLSLRVAPHLQAAGVDIKQMAPKSQVVAQSLRQQFHPANHNGLLQPDWQTKTTIRGGQQLVQVMLEVGHQPLPACGGRLWPGIIRGLIYCTTNGHSTSAVTTLRPPSQPAKLDLSWATFQAALASACDSQCPADGVCKLLKPFDTFAGDPLHNPWSDGFRRREVPHISQF
ncbi:hypothetical protein C0Q70_00263 [Pomacea canaliculata]|uniref:Reverse transcriptase domain-containing protein n=1 Tax=Pomacea canaliculata TaxID=400727 RepID=A0A2T7PW59_POMCA|nr:hypothetical protein C0Q70_00263 [Pomacea canaliculata]